MALPTSSTSLSSGHTAAHDNAPVDVVAHFGAVGDGTTDDSTVLQAAINASDFLYFPPGYTFAHATTLVPTNDSIWQFGGMRRYSVSSGGSALKYTGSGKAVNFTGVSNVELQNGKIECTNTAATAVYLNDSGLVDLTRMTLAGPGSSTGYAIKSEGEVSCQCHNTFKTVHMTGFGTGVSLSGDTNANQFINCYAANMPTGISFAKTGTDTFAGSDNLFERFELAGTFTNGLVFADAASHNVFLKIKEDGGFTSSLSVAASCAKNLFISSTFSSGGTRTDTSTTKSVYWACENAPNVPTYSIANATTRRDLDCDHAFDATGFALLSDVVAQVVNDLAALRLVNS